MPYTAEQSVRIRIFTGLNILQYLIIGKGEVISQAVCFRKPLMLVWPALKLGIHSASNLDCSWTDPPGRTLVHCRYLPNNVGTHLQLSKLRQIGCK